ncbi:MAG TPA: chemotaxis protein [Firmicutes bacterium]|nr:chemotaxis protein [Bacillota bacterium]
MNIGIVGGGRGGLSVLTLLLTIPNVNVLWISDLQDDAPAFSRAEAAGINTVKDFVPLLQDPDLDLVIEVTGVAAVQDLLNEHKRHDLSIMDAKAAKLLITIVEIREEVTGKIARNAKELISLTEEMNNSALLIRQNMQNLTNEAENLAAFGDSLAQTSQTAREETEKTQEILGLIEGISKTTRIIGLNASIEAARVGRAGEGFSVVAEEIRQLAESTAASTRKVADITENVKGYMQTIHQGIDEAKAIAHSQAQATEAVLGALNTLADVSNRLQQLAHNLFSI